MPDFEVRRDDLRTTRVTEGEPAATTANDGELQLRVDRFGLTANNVTYGAFGDALQYWQFFPTATEGWGRVPVWGYGEVVVSGVEGIDSGDVFYGYFPMSSHATMAARPGGPGFVETSPHRAELPAVYNRYARADPDGEYADEALLLRPLYGTSFLIDDFLRANEHFGADAVVLGSASSKTAYGLAFLLARAEDGPHVIGLTSPANAEFTESLGVYDRVVTYDDIADSIGAGDDRLVYVDMSGDAQVRAAVHRAAGDRLQQDVAVGVTHWEEQGGDAGGLPGPRPEFFFAPTHIERLTAELGPGELQRRMAAAWADFAPQLDGWMEIERVEGPDELEQAWRALVDGRADPRRGQIVRLP